MTRKFTIYNLQFTIKPLLFIFTFYILHFTFYITPAFAQTPPTSEVSQAIPTSIAPTSPLYTDMLVHNMFHTFSCLAVGSSVIGQPCLTYQVTKNAQGAIQSIPVLSQVNLSGGTLGATTSLIGALYTHPPVRTIDYLASVGTGLGIVKEANAQVVGSGAQVLNPILKLWQVSRNIAYLIMIIIFVIIGLMVMFRNRINPQTVITAQAALPGLVIGLILITFSYFLAALLADTAFIGTNLIGAYFSAAQENSQSNLTDTLKGESVLSIMSTFIGSGGINDLYPAVDTVIRQLGPGPGLIIKTAASFLSYQYAYQFAEVPANIVSGAGCLVAAAAAAFNPVADISGTSTTTLSNVPNCVHSATLVGKTAVAAIAAAAAFLSPASVISMALYVILIAILLYTMFRLLLRLVQSFLTIILYTIIAPFQFLIASLPGRQGIATGWILDMLANILAFPAVIAVLYFVNYLLGSQTQGFLTNKPPFPVTGGPLDLIADGSLPLLANLNTGFLRLMLAFGALISTPSIPDIISRAIGRVSQAGQLIGQEIGGGMRSGQGYINRAQQELAGTRGLYNQPGYVGILQDDGSVRVERSFDPRLGGQIGNISRLGANINTLRGKAPPGYKP